MHCVASRLGYPNYRLPNYRWSQLVRIIDVLLYFNTLHLRQNFTILLLRSGFITEMYAFLMPNIHATFPVHFTSLICSLINVWWETQTIKFLITQFSPFSCHTLTLMSNCSLSRQFYDTFTLFCFSMLEMELCSNSDAISISSRYQIMLSWRLNC